MNNQRFTIGQRVRIPALPERYALLPQQRMDRCGTIDHIETLPNGFQRIIVRFDETADLGTREVHPSKLEAI